MRIDDSRTIEVVAHRGANGVAPENTRAAVARCLDFGVDVIELDVRSSLDGELYNLHDATLDRTTDGRGPARFRRAAYIDRLDAGSWFAPEFAGERVPRIRDLIEEFRGRMKFFLDIKSGSLRRIVRIIREMGIAGDTFVWFADPLKERRFRRRAPEVALKVNVASPGEIASKALPRGARLVECGTASLSEELVAEAHRNGLRVMANCGAAGEEAFERVIAAGADLVNLDRPQDFARFVGYGGEHGA